MKKPVLFFFLLLFLAAGSQAQVSKISPTDLKKLHKQEDSLKKLVKNVIIDSFTAGRMRSDSQFVKTLVRGLLVKNSFYYPFQS